MSQGYGVAVGALLGGKGHLYCHVSECVHVCACAKWKRSGCAVGACAWVCACACRRTNWVEWEGVAFEIGAILCSKQVSNLSRNGLV
jgi:hypothetical protein